MLKINMKLSLLLALLLSVCLILPACSGGNLEGPADTNGTSDEAGDSIEINIGDTDKNKSAKLPDTYPSDLFPVYKDSFIMSAMETGGGFVVTAFSKADYTELTAFYKDVLKDAEVTSESNWDDGFTSFGKIDKYTYNFDTGASDEMEGYKSSISILLMLEE